MFSSSMKDITHQLTVVLSALWDAVGVEIMIFSLTLCAGLTVRTLALFQARAKQRVQEEGKRCQTVQQQSCEKSRVPETRESFRRVPVRVTSVAQLKKNCQPQKSGLVENIIHLAKDRPGCPQNSLGVVEMYQSLKRNNGDIRIGELTRPAKISPISFYTLVIQSVIRANKHEHLEEVLQDMADQRVERTLCFYESIMKQLAGQKQLRLALRIHDRLVAEGLEPSAVSYSCLISFAAEVGEVSRAVGFFDRLSELTTPSIRAYMTMLKMYSKMLNWPASLNIFRDMQHRGVRVDTLALNVLLGTGVSTGKISEVEALVTEAGLMVPSPLDAVSYNTLMKGYVQNTDVAKAIDVMKRMQRQGLAPSSVTFHTAMDASVRSSHQAPAWHLLEMMRAAGMTPDNYTCSILVKGLARESTPHRVKVCLEILHDGQKSCTSCLRGTLYNTVLEAAISCGDDSLVGHVVKEMKRHAVVPVASKQKQLAQILGQETVPTSK
uniref:Pentacotripeptide-repeat region of PRORP domain-containing protein n=1 Tax=Noctiluca scintillans TaxID=2966 RepID=A0A7S1A081_NOCSC|mmetsp:Transcript_26404/g.69401  ORF Transcript_26404/g.69401 Transcript_26404/m.69401 type:complete len:494 (+) Transcript_26404:74-1555(+)